MIKIEMIENTYDTCNHHIIAKKGRLGYISEITWKYFGIGKNAHRLMHIRTKLEGNKIFRDIPNWKMKLAKA